MKKIASHIILYSFFISDSFHNSPKTGCVPILKDLKAILKTQLMIDGGWISQEKKKKVKSDFKVKQ